MILKSIDDQPMLRISECRVMFGNFGRSFISPVIYKSASAKIIAMYGSVFRSLSHFRSASTDAIYLPRLPS